MAKKLVRILTISVLCTVLGLHWFALQSVAWTVMLVTYSKQAPLSQALSKTFDGKHPCSLCHVVEKGKNAEKKSDLQLAPLKLDLICSTRLISLIPPVQAWNYGRHDTSALPRGHSPPVPPPRPDLV